MDQQLTNSMIKSDLLEHHEEIRQWAYEEEQLHKLKNLLSYFNDVKSHQTKKCSQFSDFSKQKKKTVEKMPVIEKKWSNSKEGKKIFSRYGYNGDNSSKKDKDKISNKNSLQCLSTNYLMEKTQANFHKAHSPIKYTKLSKIKQ